MKDIKKALKNLPVTMNPYDEENSVPNFWLSCLLIDEDAMCDQVRSTHKVLYKEEHGKSCPTEILETLAKYNAEGRPIWKPLSLQPDREIAMQLQKKEAAEQVQMRT